MAKIDDISLKRHLLSNIRLRFSPEVQPLREAAMDSIVERIFATAPLKTACSVPEIQRIFSKNTGVHVANQDICNSVWRLIKKGSVEGPLEVMSGEVRMKGKKKELYNLTTDASKELEGIDLEAARRFDSVVKRLFNDSQAGYSAYADPFLKFLSLVFSQLADEYVQMLRGDTSEKKIVSSPVFSSALTTINKEFKSLDLSPMENAAISFFRDPDPDYAMIKWNMAQNYYLSRIIGLDASSSLLGREIFGNAVFYLDTNVVIPALAPEDKNYAAFVALSRVCDRIGAKIVVCKITLDELDRTVTRYRDMIEKAEDQIPGETACKVTSDFYEIYTEKKKSGTVVELDEIFKDFLNAADNLKNLFKAEIEDDPWFNEAQDNQRTRDFAEAVADRWAQMRPFRKAKTVAAHDAMCLMWIESVRQISNSENIWFVTRDYTLPYCVPSDCCWKSLALTMDALIQWLSPISVGGDEEKDLALAYSSLIASRILPQERIFNLEDFIIFYDLNMACKGLPPEDVEGCIQYIKTNAPMLNPAEASDREKLARIVSVYFADPSRKYQQNLEQYEAKISGIQEELEQEKGRSLKRNAWLRVTITGETFVILEIAIAAIAAIFGTGDNAFQRIATAWPFLAAVFPICVFFGWFYIGKDRLRALGWPFEKIFKLD